MPVNSAGQIITFLTVNLTLMTNMVLSTLPSPVKVNKCLSLMSTMEGFALISVIRGLYIVQCSKTGAYRQNLAIYRWGQIFVYFLSPLERLSQRCDRYRYCWENRFENFISYNWERSFSIIWHFIWQLNANFVRI